MKKGRVIALLPVAVFLAVYLGLGILFEYGLQISMGFSKVPIVIAFLFAILVACLQNRQLNFERKLEIMGKSVGDKNIITMVLIFLTAGIFVGVVGRTGAQSVAYFFLSIVPSRFALVILFAVSCFVSTAMGTSVGTITLLTPIGAELAQASGYDISLCVGTVVGGAMFGDNLSFISDTTIAACNGQSCDMRSKFRGNFWIALPAAIFSMFVVFLLSGGHSGAVHTGKYNLLQIFPYLLVLAGGIAGINVFLVLLLGIVCGSAIALLTATASLQDLLFQMGTGAHGMFETSMVAVLVAALCGLIREYGGFDALLYHIRRIFKGNRGGQLGIGILVGIMDVATANNTVAIVMANPIAKEMSRDYAISPQRTACLLDTFSCISQGLIPYGAQLLVATTVAVDMGYHITALSIMPYLYYPYFLLACSLAAIYFSGRGIHKA